MGFVMSVCPSICPYGYNSTPTGRIFVEFDIWKFSENRSTKFGFQRNLTIITGTLLEEVRKFVTISRWIILRLRNVSDRSCIENQNTLFFSFFRKSCRLCHNVEKYDMIRPQMRIRRRCCACRITKATDTKAICNNWLFFHGNNSYTNVYMYIACPV